MTTIKGYKFIQSNMKSKNGNIKWVVGKWMKYTGKLELCESGFHACLTPKQAFEYTYGGLFCVVEARGEIIHDKDNKFVASEMRILKAVDVKPIAVEYAIACALRQLKNYENKYPKDKRVRVALVAAKKYLAHPTEENRSAARSAAWSAASAASAARSAAESAAWSAASAARSAAESAARSATSAARSAAESAAWSAASATSAAWRASSAAWSAAWRAASAAEKWQEKTLQRIVNKHLKKRGAR